MNENENDKARASEEQATETRRQWEVSYGHRREDWPDPLREPYEPAPDELSPGADHGLRRGELLALRRDDIDLRSRQLHVRRAIQRVSRLGPAKPG